MEKLVQEYGEALDADYEARCEVETCRAYVESLEAKLVGGAEEAGKINGKNKDTRDVQRKAVLSLPDNVLDAARGDLADARQLAHDAEVDRKKMDALIGLTEAWLHSLSE